MKVIDASELFEACGALDAAAEAITAVQSPAEAVQAARAIRVAAVNYVRALAALSSRVKLEVGKVKMDNVLKSLLKGLVKPNP